LPRPFPLADLLQRRLALTDPCSWRAIFTIHTCLPAQGWQSALMKSIANRRCCLRSPQVRLPPDFRLLMLRSASSLAGARTLAGRARRELRLR